jgi:CubicO group peptidase (beta-lactamase class C family)
LLIAFFVLAALVLHHANSAADRAPVFGQPQQAEDESSAARIARIENGLLPAVVIKGKSARAMKLSERMQFYKVPGVSVAFFDHGRIIWTRAYGLADIATNKACDVGHSLSSGIDQQAGERTRGTASCAGRQAKPGRKCERQAAHVESSR